MGLIELAHLKSVLRYNPETGIWAHLTGGRRWKAGDRADKPHQGYLEVRYNGKRYLAHRLAFFYRKKRWPIGIDHKDRNGLNNKWKNLREANQHHNSANTKLNKRNKSGCRGVFWNVRQNLWEAQIKLNGKSTSLGLFKEKERAAAEYRFHAKHYFGGYYVAP